MTSMVTMAMVYADGRGVGWGPKDAGFGRAKPSSQILQKSDHPYLTGHTITIWPTQTGGKRNAIIDQSEDTNNRQRSEAWQTRHRYRQATRLSSSQVVHL